MAMASRTFWRGSTVLLNDYGSTGSTLATTTTGLGVSASAITVGASVTLSATVTGAAGSAGTPTGTVTFYDGTTLLGTGTLSAGLATYATAALPVGSDSVTAVYGGDSNFGGSTSAASVVVVSAATTPIGTSTALTASATTAVSGTSITFTATVTPATGRPCRRGRSRSWTGRRRWGRDAEWGGRGAVCDDCAGGWDAFDYGGIWRRCWFLGVDFDGGGSDDYCGRDAELYGDDFAR